MADIDPRLISQLDAAGDKGDVEAVMVLAGGAGATAARARGQGQAGAPGDALVNRVAEQLKEEPQEVRHFPKLGAVFVKGSGRLVRRLLEDDQVVAASATDAEL